MINFIKKIFKSKEIIKDRDSYKIRDALLQKIELKKSEKGQELHIKPPLGNVSIPCRTGFFTCYINKLEQELRACMQEDGLTNARFNQIESTYEKAKHQNPNHPSVKTFVNIAREYYKQKINQAEKKGENTIAYNMALQRYE